MTLSAGIMLCIGFITTWGAAIFCLVRAILNQEERKKKSAINTD